MKDLVRVRYCPACGAAAFGTASEKSYACGACGFLYYHNLAAAVMAVIRHEGRMLWTVRAADPGQGLLDLPGAFADYGETLEEAVLREIREETGIVAPAPRYLFSAPNRYFYRGVLYHTLDAVFDFELAARPELVFDAEIADAHWLAPDEVDAERIAFPSVRLALERLRGT